MSPLVGIIVTSRDIALEKDAFRHTPHWVPMAWHPELFAHLLGEKGVYCVYN